MSDNETIDAIADIIGPHLDIRHGHCGGTGLDPRSSLDCTGCDGTGYDVRGQGWRAEQAREVASEVLAVLSEAHREAPESEGR